MKIFINKEMIKKLNTSENIKKFKESQEKTKLLCEHLKKSLIVDIETYRKPFDI